MKKNSTGAGKGLLSILKFILLIIVCVSASIILVWPLWKFSTSFPKIYTVIVLILLSIGLLFLLVKKIIKSDKIQVLKIFGNIVFSFAGLFLAVKSVINEQRLFALIIFVAALAIIILYNFIFSKFRHD